MSKGKKILISVISVLTAVCIGVYIFSYVSKWSYYRMHYYGDRITVNLYVTIDGEPVKTEDIQVRMSNEIYVDNVYASKDNEENTIKVTDNGEYTSFSVKADSYGDYNMYADIAGCAFHLFAYQWNWWDVQRCNLYIDIDTKRNEFKVSETYSHISEEDGYKKIECSEPETVNEISAVNYITVGCKG
ncbi:MAG: hypothetical protein NC397_00635 [Clostridium sp.]|nr:hypothetical protein [Clostridium sp.]